MFLADLDLYPNPVIVDEEELDDGSDLDLTPANALNQQA
jgi:hypothetical protein